MKNKENPVLDFLKTVLIAIILAVAVRFFLLEPRLVQMSSMEPTLLPGDRVMVNKLALRLGELSPTDIVVFHFPLDSSTVYIKRLIAMPGQTVELKQGELLVDGQKIPENYLAPDASEVVDYGPVTVPADSYFVMGDNRMASSDSRAWGPVPRSDIIGKAQVLFWPIDRLKVVR